MTLYARCGCYGRFVQRGEADGPVVRVPMRAISRRVLAVDYRAAFVVRCRRHDGRFTSELA